MFCPQCGFNNDQQSRHCSQCGAALQPPAAIQPPVPQYPAPPPQYPAPGAQPYYAPPPFQPGVPVILPPVPNYMTQAVLVTLFCCLPLGIVGIIARATSTSVWRQMTTPARSRLQRAHGPSCGGDSVRDWSSASSMRSSSSQTWPTTEAGMRISADRGITIVSTLAVAAIVSAVCLLRPGATFLLRRARCTRSRDFTALAAEAPACFTTWYAASWGWRSAITHFPS